MRRDPFNGQAVQSFYLVTPFWNLKRVLAPRTRCYYHGYHGWMATANAHYHLTRAQIGSRIAGRAPRRQSTGVKALRWSGGASQACHRKLGPSWPRISLPVTATTLRTIHVARNQATS